MFSRRQGKIVYLLDKAMLWDLTMEDKYNLEVLAQVDIPAEINLCVTIG